MEKFVCVILKFVYGIKSLVKEPNRNKFMGFAVPLSIIVFVLLNKNFHPALKLLISWTAIPTYIWFLGSMYLRVPKQNRLAKENNYNQYEYKEDHINPVSHVERKTVVTNTTTTTETIYFRKERNLID